MASDPPFSTPRIVEVMDPTVNQHVVMVLMTTSLAKKYPDKPWGTPIDQIGLQKRDSDLFPGYILVDFEPVKDSSDLFWIFQNLETAPTWTTATIGQRNLTPEKYRGQVVTTEYRTEVAPDTVPTSLSGDLILSVVQQRDNTGKALKVDTTEVIDVDADPLIGQRAYVEREVADTEESLVDDGEPTDEGLFISQSSVSPIGNGKSIKETVSVPSWTEHPGSNWDEELGIQIPFTEQFVAPPTVFTEENTSFRPVNKDRALKIVEEIPEELIDAYLDYWPTRVNLNDLPRELLSVNVVWNQSVSLGTQDYAFAKTATGTNWSISADASDAGNASASLSADIQFTYRDIASNNLYGTEYEFFLPRPITTAAVLAKLATILGGAVSPWPVFRPQSQTITAKGQSVSVRANVSVGLNGTTRDGELTESGWYHGESDDFATSIGNQSVQIQPCIHGAIEITGGTSRTLPVAAVAGMTVFHSSVGAITSIKVSQGVAEASVEPSALAATSGPTTIPTSGYYLHAISPSKYKYKRSRILAVVFDAANLGDSPPTHPWNV